MPLTHRTGKPLSEKEVSLGKIDNCLSILLTLLDLIFLSFKEIFL